MTVVKVGKQGRTRVNVGEVVGQSRAKAGNLPDCPSCDASDTLTPTSADVAGSIWCACSCCSKPCLVKDGRIVHPAPRTDVSRQQMDGP